MDILSIQTFVSVTQTRSFSKTAEQLFLTQPAVSKRIAALEEHLECRLFDRIGRKILLTEAGQALYPRAQKILLEVEDSRRSILNLSGKVTGKLSFGTSHHIGLHRLPPILNRFNERFPDVDMDIHFLDSENACDAVENGSLEMAIVTLPDDGRKNLTQIHLWDDPLIVVAGKRHPLAQKSVYAKKRLDPQDLVRFSAILPGPGTFTRRIIEADFQKSNISIRVDISTNYLETIKMLVSVGLGWSVLPVSMISEDTLAVLNVNKISPYRSLGVVHHSARTLSNAGKALIRMSEQFGSA